MKLALIGYGRMGRAVEAAAAESRHAVVARLDLGDRIDGKSLAGADVAVDFTLPDAVADNVSAIADAGVDLVIGTTGWYERMEDVAALVRSAGVGCLWSPNFSLGVHLFFRVAAAAGDLADALGEYDVHVHETHHRHKVDRPSGTAVRLAELLVGRLRGKRSWMGGPPEGAAAPEILWVSSTRAGEVPGVHEVGLEGPSDSVVVRHTARGREGFARGAVSGAEWVHGREGFFSMDDMLAERLGSI